MAKPVTPDDEEKTVQRDAQVSMHGPGEEVARFEDMLLENSRDRGLGKRLRTRFLLLTIVARCIQKDPSKDPTLDQVLEQSGTARSTFYTNFKDVEECVTEVLTLFFEYVAESRASGARELSSYQAILDANSWYCHFFEANAGLFAAVARSSKVLKDREDQNYNWARKVVHVSEKRRGAPFSKAVRKEYEGVVRLLITMTIEAARERFVLKDKLLVATYRTPSALATALTAIWYRMTVGYEQSPRLPGPPESKLPR